MSTEQRSGSCLILDDEPLAVRRLTRMLERTRAFDSIIAATDPVEALSLIETARPAVLFLDIEMPGLDGFRFIDSMSGKRLPVFVFVTAFDNYAPKAFEYGATDFILKPFSQQRLECVVERAMNRLNLLSAEARLAALRRSVQEARERSARDREEEQSFWRRDAAAIDRIPVAGIERISAERDYVRIFYGEKSALVKKSLSALEEKLDSAAFVRVHRSHIVRISAVQKISRAAGAMALTLVSGAVVPVGRKYLKAARQRLPTPL